MDNETETAVTETAEVAKAPVKERAKPWSKTKRRARDRAEAVDTKALLKTPEAQAAIASAVEKATAGLLEKLSELRTEAGTPAQAGDADVLNRLAAVLIEMGDQGQNRPPRITPEETSARRLAREDMERLILEAVAEDREATYELTRAVFFEEQLIDATYVNPMHVRCVQTISWPGVPDESMRPTNATAQGIYESFLKSIGGRTREARVPYRSAAQKYGVTGLKVHGRETVSEAPIVASPRMAGGLKIHRPEMQGQVTETRVLGTLAEPARQAA